jgi:hypothetical protein
MQGDAKALNRLGTMYAHGQGVPQNFAQAVKWFRKAAAQGYEFPEINVVRVPTHSGKGVLQNDLKAGKGHVSGYARAQNNLGDAYYFGRGVPQNYVKAVKWFRLAAAQEYTRAQYSLGAMYAHGQGVPKNCVLALKWFLIAKASGDKNAAKPMRLMERIATPAQTAQARILALRWLAAHPGPSALPGPGGGQMTASFSRAVAQALYLCVQGHHPLQNLTAGLGGTATVAFVYQNQQATYVKLRQSTGPPSLDRAILSAVRTCPLPAVPRGVIKRSLLVQFEVRPGNGR